MEAVKKRNGSLKVLSWNCARDDEHFTLWCLISLHVLNTNFLYLNQSSLARNYPSYIMFISNTQLILLSYDYTNQQTRVSEYRDWMCRLDFCLSYWFAAWTSLTTWKNRILYLPVFYTLIWGDYFWKILEAFNELLFFLFIRRVPGK